MIESQGAALVIMATFNGEHYVREQLDSIYNQLKVSVSVICHDDGSTDSTVDILAEYSASKGLILLRDDFRGGSAAKNFRHLMNSVDPNGYDVVLFADQDDIWFDNKVFVALEKVRQGVSLYSSALAPFSDDGAQYSALKATVNLKRYDHLFQGLSAGCTYAMSVSFFKEVQSIIAGPWFDRNDFSHDWLVYTIARSRNASIFHDPRPMIRYRQHAMNVQGASAGIGGVFYRLRNINAGWYSGQISFNKTLFLPDSKEFRIIRAFEQGDLWTLLANITHLRRSIHECVAVICLSILGRTGR